jgi:hypothetical protein
MMGKIKYLLKILSFKLRVEKEDDTWEKKMKYIARFFFYCMWMARIAKVIVCRNKSWMKREEENNIYIKK